MRVLFLAPQPFYRLRGMCLAQKQCLETLSAMGAEVDALVYPFGEDVALPGLRLLRLPRLGLRDVPIGPSAQKVLLAPVLFAAAFAMLARRKYDVVHACEEAAWLAAPLKALFRFKLVYDMDDVLSERLRETGFVRSPLLLALARRAESAVLSAADLVLTNCSGTTARAGLARRVVFYHHAPPLPASAPGDARRRHGLEAGPLAFYAGNLEPYQGVDLLLESLLHAPELRCAIAGGRREQIEALSRRAGELGVAARVRWLGPLPLEESFALMRAADVLVSPLAQAKAVPMKLYAYLASGRPIAATDMPSQRALLGERAALCPARPDALAAAMTQALTRTAVAQAVPGAAPLRAAYATL